MFCSHPNKKDSEYNDTRSVEVVTQHSLFWLVFGNLVGVLLATFLLFPKISSVFEPLTYGRWVAVHLNAGLYGWSSIPLIGLLFVLFLPKRGRSPLAELSVMIWSAALLFSIIGWLTGHTSGKLFMEWTGASRWVMALGMLFLAIVLWISFFRRLRYDDSENDGSVSARMIIAIKFLTLIVLSCIPFAIYLAANPAVYPPVNPDSGGATGGSLLGSTLIVVMIYWCTPFLLGLNRSGRPGTVVPTFIVLLIHPSVFFFLDHGDKSHHEWIQIVALSSLIIWVPLLVHHTRLFDWPPGSKMWLGAFAIWGGLLTVTGIITFLPRVLEHWKFTNALVAHVHIAMAGMITSFNVLVLVVLNQHSRARQIFSSPSLFWCWQIGTIVHAWSMLVAGTFESLHPDWLFTGHPLINFLYFIRLAAGILMTAASVKWFWLAHGNREEKVEVGML
jgi:cytochrome c oxidase cbb3-type subunit 1